MPDYQIVTDATADISKEMFEGLPMPHIIPMQVSIAGENHLYGVAEGLTMTAFFQAQRDDKDVRTSQINPYAYEEEFSKLLEENNKDILYVAFGSGLSASVGNAISIKEQIEAKYPGRRIVIVDTLCAATGEALVVLDAVRKQAEGWDIDRLAKWIEENRLHMLHWFTVDNLKYLQKGGRVSAPAAFFGKMLNIKPVMNMNNEGKLVAKIKALGKPNSLKELIKKFNEEYDPSYGKTIIIGQTENMEAAKFVEKAVRETHPDLEIFIVDVGPVIAAHTGPGLTVISYWGKGRI